MRLSALPLLTDENIDQQVVAYLRGLGLEVKDVKEEGLIGSEDVLLLRLAMSESRAIITHDSDFGTLAVVGGEPYQGIIYLRPGHIRPEFTIGTLQTLLIQDPELTPPFIIVAVRSGAQVRIRIRQQIDTEDRSQ